MSNGRTSLTLPEGLARVLDRVRQRYLAVRAAEFPVLIVAIIAMAWVLQATADRWLELSWNVRAVLLSLDGFMVLALLWVFLITPLRERLDRKKAALLIEREMPRFKTSLISAVEFAEGGAEYPQGSRSLVEKLLNDTAEEVAGENVVRGVVRADRLKRFFKWMIAALVIATGCFIWALPLSPLLVQRVLLSNTAFPDETKVVTTSGDLVIIAGTDANLSAKAEGEIPQGGRLVVIHPSGTTETIRVSPSRTEEGVFHYPVRNVREGFRYRFELHDGVGEEHQVSVRIPPTLQGIKFVQVYPKYTGLGEKEMSPANLRLLEGSKLKIEAAGSEALESAMLEIKGVEAPIPVKIEGDKKDQVKAELTVPGTGWKSISIHLVSAAGEVSANDPVYRVDLVIDRPATIVVTEPKKETLTVVAGAKVPFRFKISDDFGIKRAFLAYRVFRPTVGGAMEPAEEGELPIIFDGAEKSFSRTLEWELSRLVPSVTVGSSINCWIEAEDNNPAKTSSSTKSSEKRIQIVSEEQKRMELLELLGERAKDIERLYELQRGMNEKTDNLIR